MGTKYATISVSGYNSSPPADNGSTDATNQVLWSTIKAKLPDPLKTAIEAVNSALVTYTDTSVRSITASDSTVAGDHLRTVQTASTVTSVVTISLMDAATAAAGYMVRVHNGGQANLTVGRATGADTINGALKNVTLGTGQAALFVVNATTNGYLMVSGNTPISDASDPSKQMKFDVSGVTTGTVRTLIVPDVSDTLVTLSATQELDNKTLDSSVGKGTWTASGTWTLPALTLGGTVSGGGNQLNNVIIGTVTPLAGYFTTGGFTGAVNFDAGAVSAPGLYLEGETGTGLYRIGANNHGYAVSGAKVLDIASTGLAVTGALSATGAINTDSTTDSTSTTTGSIQTDGGLGVAKAAYIGGSLNISGASAGQIVFPATQNASGDANTLDDYEEGSYTVTATCGTSGTITLSSNTGYYTKVGNLVTANGVVLVSSVSSPTGVLQILLPFSAGASQRSPAVVWADPQEATGTGVLVGDINAGNIIQVYKITAGVLSTATSQDVKSGTYIWFSATYRT